MIDKRLIKNKISLLQKDLIELEKLSKFGFQEVVKNFYYYSTLEHLLERTVDRASSIASHLVFELKKEAPQSFRESFEKLEKIKVYSPEFVEKIVPAAGLRNRLVHEYDDIDKEIVYKSIPQAIEVFKQYIKHILNFIEKK